MKKIFTIHRWCGLVAGLLLLLISSSGAILVFADEIEYTQNKAWLHADNPHSQFNIDTVLHSLQKQYTGHEIRIYHFPASNSNMTIELRKDGKRQRIYAHPFNGSIAQTIPEYHKSFEIFLLSFHYSLLSGATGKLIVFITGTGFLFTLITGFLLYRRSVTKVLLFKSRISFKSKTAFYSSIHRVIGVYTLIFNLFLVTTGLTLSYKIVTNAFAKFSPAKQNTTTPIPYNALVQKVLTQYPEFEIQMIRHKGGETVQIAGRLKSDPAVYGEYASGVQINIATQAIEKETWLHRQSIGEKLLAIAAPLHFGNYGGVPLKILYCIIGIMPAILSITGFLVWKNKKC